MMISFGSAITFPQYPQGWLVGWGKVLSHTHSTRTQLTTPKNVTITETKTNEEERLIEKRGLHELFVYAIR
jgi:hypothetical protein